jgi:hypothetical protein
LISISGEPAKSSYLKIRSSTRLGTWYRIGTTLFFYEAKGQRKKGLANLEVFVDKDFLLRRHMPEVISYVDWLPLVLVLRLLKMFTAYVYADPGSLSLIPDPNFSIPDPGSATLKKIIPVSLNGCQIRHFASEKIW